QNLVARQLWVVEFYTRTYLDLHGAVSWLHIIKQGDVLLFQLLDFPSSVGVAEPTHCRVVGFALAIVEHCDRHRVPDASLDELIRVTTFEPWLVELATIG